MAWQSVPAAASYTVDVEFRPGGETGDVWGSHVHQDGITATTYSTDFVGAQMGRWRVTTVGPDGPLSPPSEWRTFLFTQ